MPVALDAPLGCLSSGAPDDQPLGRIRATVRTRRCPRSLGIVDEMSMLDLRMMVDEPLHVGELVTIELQPERWPCLIEATGIVHCAEATIGGELLGVFLAEPLPEDFAAACWLEMRRELRYPCDWPVWVRFGVERALLRGSVRNYSRSGLQLMVERMARKGEALTVISEEPLAECVVRWAAPHRGKNHILGCSAASGAGLKLALRLQHANDASGAVR